MLPAVWTGLYAELPLDEALQVLHEQGWRAFEASTEHLVAIETDDSPKARIDEVRECLTRLDITMPQAHALLQAKVADADVEKRGEDMRRLSTHLQIAAQMGVRDVVIHPGGSRGSTTRAERARVLDLNIRAFRQLGDQASDLNLRIGIENMMHREPISSSTLLDLLEAIDHPSVGATLDTSHMKVMGLDIPAAVHELAPRLMATHISDNDGSGDQHLTPGNGRIDWLPVMAAFRETNYAGLFNLEIPGERHPHPGLRAIKSKMALEVANWLLARDSGD